jgi:hypothetical protein
MRCASAKTDWPTAVHAVLLAALIVAAAMGAGCGSKDAAQQADVRAALKAASAALVSRDAVAWFLALPCEGTTAQYDSCQTYIGLSRYPWAKVTAKADPVGGVQGRYRVRFYGRLKGSDTSPLLCERVLDFAWREGRLRLVADRTDEWSRGTYYFAFTRPLVIVRPQLVVVGDRWHRKLMSRIAACDGQTQRVAARLHQEQRQRVCGSWPPSPTSSCPASSTGSPWSASSATSTRSTGTCRSS